MFASVLFLLLFFPVSFLLVTVEIFFTPEELTEMGIRLDKPCTLETI